jgi:hypothetical protein
MGTVYRETYTKPLPDGAELVTRTCRSTTDRTPNAKRRPEPTMLRLYQCLYQLPANRVWSGPLLTNRPSAIGKTRRR